MNITGMVIRDYTSAFAEPLLIKKNTTAVISHCDLQYPGWVWIIPDAGAAGWGPQQFFLPRSENEVICLEDYTAHELSVFSGESIAVIKSLNGWYWVTNTAGESGWVPGDCIVLV